MVVPKGNISVFKSLLFRSIVPYLVNIISHIGVNDYLKLHSNNSINDIQDGGNDDFEKLQKKIDGSASDQLTQDSAIVKNKNN